MVVVLFWWEIFEYFVFDKIGFKWGINWKIKFRFIEVIFFKGFYGLLFLFGFSGVSFVFEVKVVLVGFGENGKWINF